MPETSEISTGEIARGLAAIRGDMKDVRADIKELAAEIKKHPDKEDLQLVEETLRREIAAETATREAERKVADKAIKALEDWNSWALRIVLGAAGTAGITWAVAQALNQT